MNNMSLSQDITPNFEAMNSNIYPANDNQMYVPAAMPNIAGNMSVNYPEIYYKIQPHIMMACDHMDAYGLIPTKEIMEKTAENIHSDVVKMHPEMAEYANVKKSSDPMPEARSAIISDFGFGFDRGFDRDFGHGGFRRGGALRDIIDILLLSEFHHRRRRHFW